MPELTNDPKDRHILAVAFHAACRAVVTENLVDFPALARLCPLGRKAPSSCLTTSPYTG
jgi:hypothetical protein